MAQTASVPTYWSYFSINNLLSSFRNVIYMSLAKIFMEVISYFINSFPKHIHVLCSIFIMPCVLGHCHAKTSISWSFRDYTTPGHHFASSVIDCKIQVMMLKKVTWPFPIVIIIIKALYVDLGFIKVNDLLSVNHCQILMLLIPF
ncbi:hypothetical protein RO3G_10527 [Rhizopus delemar RA 99-880]|uniref:Uncharacterized protein n=1 Tax=Rhizopus delemar (strain RA 99-880 / ATCC MYA-4621 / FGSC 9543 / NRRL 43880) TaxID=246409 RepID=I1CBI7_RHIO9|nr:hypothetical protein RO3G_10527 [Rhizopus delemar RA 99-880]|eukprot:EIE85817.1 hypothetical protein RO3G_10527 [Rhizopus delemar RA 99-880]